MVLCSIIVSSSFLSQNFRGSDFNLRNDRIVLFLFLESEVNVSTTPWVIVLCPLAVLIKRSIGIYVWGQPMLPE